MEIPPPTVDPASAKGCSRWDLIQQRIEAAQSALERQLNPSFETRRELLSSRARLLAKPPEIAPSGKDWLEVVEFHLAYEKYAVETRYIREVGVLRELRPLPGTPPFVLGLMNIRSQILSVIDLKKFFALPDKGLTDLNQVLVLRSPQMEVGVVTDAILPVRLIARHDLESPMPTISGIRANFAKAVAPGPVVLLDVDRILADTATVVNGG